MNRLDFVTHLGLEVQTLDLWLEQAWLVPQRGDSEIAFTGTDLARAKLILDLKGRFGVNDEGVDIILHLLDQLHGFRRAFEGLHAEIRER